LECFASMQQLLDQHADQVAAVIIESMCQGAAGMQIYPPAYLSRLEKLCHDKNVLLIVDEIAMGFGRTGRMFAFQHADINPDIVAIGKGLSAGYLPISATIVKSHIYHQFADQPQDHTFYHGHTFAGNPIACAVSLEALAIYAQDEIPQRATRLQEILIQHLSPLRDHPCVQDVRVLGLVGAVEFKPPKGAEIARQIQNKLFAQGILVRPLGNVVYLMPPLVISEETLADLTTTFQAAVP